MQSHVRRALVALSATLLILTIPATSVGAGATADYVVVAERGASSSAVKAAIKAAGGKVTGQNAAIDTYSATGPASGFILAVSASAVIDSAAHAKPIGSIPGAKPVKEVVPDSAAIAAANKAGNAQGKKPGGGSTAGLDPLDGGQWGLKMVRSDLARAVNAGDRRVLVGIIDSGIDFTHPDLVNQVDFGFSRNFAIDIPSIDGPCEVASCLDPVGTDDNGHGTHVSGIVAAEANGLGISGVAPGVRLVELKGGQDSGFVFLEPVVNALTYAADHGIDVVNMSFYVDPWLYNCQNNPADSPEAQAEQRAIVVALSRALDYANSKNVTLINSLGNNHEDVGHPRTDVSSPDFVSGTAYPRVIDNATCLNLPSEGPHVISVSALGPSTAKADYSNYGIEQTSVSAPGGWFRDLIRTPDFRTNPEPDPLDMVPGSGRCRRLDRRRRQHHAGRGGLRDGQELQRHRVRLLPLHPGHLDGVPARHRRGCTDRQPLRDQGQQAGWPPARPPQDRVRPARDGVRACLPDPATSVLRA